MNNKNPIKVVHIFITGRVQGVSYRWWFQNEGEKRKLKGWVRNRTSNRVEAEITGEKKNIDEMIEKCKKGPPLADVEEVVINGSVVKNNSEPIITHSKSKKTTAA